MEPVSWLHQQLAFCGLLGLQIHGRFLFNGSGAEDAENKHIFQEYDVQVEHITSVISIDLEFSKVAMSSCQQILET